MEPERKRRHSPYVGAHDTELVHFTAEWLDPASEEFQRRQRREGYQYPPGHPMGPKADDTPPPA